MEEDLGNVVDEAHFFIEKVWKIKIESIFRTARGERQVLAVGLPNHLTERRVSSLLDPNASFCTTDKC
jgi:hypothetical protein